MKPSKSRKFYITTTLPYVNAAPHLGHALEFVQADIIARYHRDVLGEEIFFNTGTDEHGLKIYQKALENKKDPQAYVDEYAEKFKEFCKALNMDYTAFIRTTDSHHIKAAQEFWRRCYDNGDIEKRLYRTKYCVGCELEKTDSELVNGKCPLHPVLEIEMHEEENYFFKFSNYREKLLKLYENPQFVIPESRLNEISSFVSAGPKDFSISRLKSKMPWGIPVPGDDTQVMYVWFDALINYISTLGWPENNEKFEEFWGTDENPNAVQIAGKDNLRQQSAMWQAMLMSAGLPNSKNILIHGFITGGGGLKMSKTLGNVVDPMEVVREFGTDALRYWFAREVPTFEDGDFTIDKFKESYNANLANGLGNLVSRVMKMAVVNGVSIFTGDDFTWAPEFEFSMGQYDLREAADFIWGEVKYCDDFIQQTEPFRKTKTNPDEARENIKKLLLKLHDIGWMLKPFMPVTSEKILKAVRNSEEIKTPLFPRLK